MFYYEISFSTLLALCFIFFIQVQVLFLQIVPFFLYTLDIVFKLLIIYTPPLRTTPSERTLRNATIKIALRSWYSHTAWGSLIYGVKVFLLLLNPLYISLSLGELILDIIVFTLIVSESTLSSSM